MKLFYILFFALISSSLLAQNDTISEWDTTSTKLNIDNSDSLVSLFANMQSDHDFFGYAKPDTNSAKLIIFSIFTNQVKDNPHQCKYGAHYSDTSLDSLSIKFIGNTNQFGEFQVLKNNKVIDLLYFKKENFRFEE